MLTKITFSTALALVALFSNPLNVLPVISGLPLSLPSTPVLLCSAFLFGSSIRSSSNDAKTNINKRGEDDETKPRETVTDPLEGHLKSSSFFVGAMLLTCPSGPLPI